MKSPIVILFLCFFAISCSQVAKGQKEEPNTAKNTKLLTSLPANMLNLSDEEWKSRLSDDEYYILRQKGTERSFTGKYWNNKKEGNYHCTGCGLSLFSSDTKFKSGTGWPSFYEPIQDGHVTKITDNSHGMSRVEVVCAYCQGHLGHVFDDGPQPTGLRYCINGNILNFVEKEDE